MSKRVITVSSTFLDLLSPPHISLRDQSLSQFEIKNKPNNLPEFRPEISCTSGHPWGG
jgi:hypothetical protein